MSTQRMVLETWLKTVSLAEKPSDLHLKALSEVLYTAHETGIIDYKIGVDDYIQLVKLGVLASKLDADEIKLIKM